MKKIFTLLLAFIALSAVAQISKNDLKRVSKESLPIRHNPINPSRATTNIAIDYDSFDVRWTAQNTPPDSMYYFSWSINRNNPNDSLFTLDYAVLTMDTLIDVNNNFAGTPRAGTTVTVDSFDLIVAHDNKSGLNDTLVVSVFDKNTATVTGTGVNAVLNTTPLWSDTIIFNGDFLPTDSLFYLLTYSPNVTLPVGHVAGIRVDFKGPVADQFFVIGSYRDRCSSVDYADTNKIAPRNSSFYWNYLTLSSLANWSTNQTLPGSTTNCRYFLLQNFLFYPYLTLNTPSGSACTPDPGTVSGVSPASSAVPCISQGVPFTQTFTFVVPTVVAGGAATVTSVRFDSIVNLPAGLTYAFDQTPATYVGGAKGCFIISGTTNAACGQYQMPIYATINTSIGPFSGELSQLASQAGIAGYEMRFLRVKASAGVCPAVNSTQTVRFVADASCGIVVNLVLTTSSTAVSCFGDSDGTATVSATGGSNYTYSWNTNPVQTTATATGLSAGTYNVTVTSGTATATASVSVSQPSAALTASATSTQSSCVNSTGTATVTPAGGTPNYTIVWNNNQTTSTISNIGAGTYSVTVTDSKGCVAFATTTVTTPGGPSATAVTTAVACFGGTTGGVDVTVTGGTAPLTYTWSPASGTGPDLTNVAAGTYNLTVVDANSCSFSLSATVNQPSAALTVTAASTQNTGIATATPAGGTPAYAYSWSTNPVQTTASATGLTAGTYTVTVTDANNCTATASVTVVIVGITETGNEISDFSIFPNPANDKLNVVMDLKDVRSVQLNVIDVTGKVIYSVKESVNGKVNREINVSAFTPGVYIIEAIADKQAIRRTFNVVR